MRRWNIHRMMKWNYFTHQVQHTLPQSPCNEHSICQLNVFSVAHPPKSTYPRHQRNWNGVAAEPVVFLRKYHVEYLALIAKTYKWQLVRWLRAYQRSCLCIDNLTWCLNRVPTKMHFSVTSSFNSNIFFKGYLSPAIPWSQNWYVATAFTAFLC